MAKFAVLFVLAVLALQNSNSTKTINLPEGVSTFPDKIKETVAKHNIELVIEELQKEVDELLAKNDKDERLCGPKVHEFISALVKNSQSEVEVCVNNAEGVAKDLQNKLALLGEQTNALGELLGDEISKCSKEHPWDVLGFASCVEENTKDLRERLEKLELQMGQISYQTLKSIEEALEELDVCLAKSENKVTLESRAIVSGLNQCVQNVNMLYTRSLPNKVNEIIVKHNVEDVIIELKKEVDDLLALGERIERLCGPKTHNLIETLTKEVHNEANQCFVQFSTDLEQFDTCLAKVENKVTLEGRAIVYSVNQCIQNVGMLYTRSQHNEDIVHNVEAVIVELKKEVEDLLNRGERIERLCGPKAHSLVEALTHKAQNKAAECLAPSSLEQFEICLAKVENRATIEGRAIVSGVNQCIQNVGMLYSRMWSEEISEIVYKHNVEAIVDNLKKDVEELLAINEKDERLCGPKADEIIEKLFEDSLLDVDQCLATMSSPNALQELDVCLGKVENKVNLEGRAIISGLNQCIRNVDLLYSRSLPMNKVVAEYKLKLKSLFVEMKSQVENLLATSEKNERLCGPKVHQIVELVEKNSQVEAGLCVSTVNNSLMPPQVLLNEVNLCLLRVNDKIVSQRNVIVEGLMKCIHNAEMLY